jgi:molybdate transport system substrate-binding protein
MRMPMPIRSSTPARCSPSRLRRKTLARAATTALLLAALLATSLAAGCGASTTAGAAAAGSSAAPPSATITVFAASSLTEAFTKLGADFTAAHPNVKVTFNFAGSQLLATQIEQGAPADVFAAASKTNMDAVASLVAAPATFADNVLEIVVSKGDPLGITALADLSKSGLKLVLAAPSVPAGKYAAQALAAQKIVVHPVSLEDNVKAVLTKVSLGEADAGIVYMTDVKAAGDKIEGVQIPAAQNIVARYPIGVVTASKHGSDAQAFVDYVLSTAGQQTLSSFGFLPPTTQ